MCRPKEIGKRHAAHRPQCRLPRTAQGVGAFGRPDGRGVVDEAFNDLILWVGEHADPFFAKIMLLNSAPFLDTLKIWPTRFFLLCSSKLGAPAQKPLNRTC